MTWRNPFSGKADHPTTITPSQDSGLSLHVCLWHVFVWRKSLQHSNLHEAHDQTKTQGIFLKRPARQPTGAPFLR